MTPFTQPEDALPAPVGQSAAFIELMESVSRAAPLDRPVLVIGERGTGKELVAARLHYLSRRWEGPLVRLNCAALAESLLESELFGHEAHAFTGAARRRIGRFELAGGGTLVLDEIANAAPPVQEKILRVVEYGTFERVGGNETVAVDTRVIASTNVDLRAAVAAGRFRADLLDRLAFEVLTVPPLRARGGDILLLAQHFGRAMAHELGWPSFPGFSPSAASALDAHAWPGNVRELKNVVERAVSRWPRPQTPIDALDFDPFASPYAPKPEPSATAPSSPPPDLPPQGLRGALAAQEKTMLSQSLVAHRYNQRAAARALGLSYHQYRHALRRHDLTSQAKKSGMTPTRRPR